MTGVFERYNSFINTEGSMTGVFERYNSFINAGDPYIRQFWFLKSMKPMLLLISLYILFVTYLGPQIMKSRKAMELRKLIIVYNFALVLYNTYFLLGGLYFLFRLGPKLTFCDNTLDTRTNPLIAKFYYHGYIMYVMRYVELIDTIFLVLSKKFKAVTPLHVFHHSIVPIFGWFVGRSEKSGYLSAYMGLNAFIHIIMYSYYAVAALGPEYQKYLWWKKYLTVVQILQFLVLSVYLMVMYALGCTTSHFVGICSYALMIVFFFWFSAFYRRTFLVDGHKKFPVCSKNGIKEQ